MTPSQREHYEKCLAEGTSPTLAEMFATGQTPGIQTDSTFLAGMYSANEGQFEAKPEMGDRLAADLRARGGSPKGKVYISGLAAYPGDPRAWVSGKGDISRIAEERNLSVSGAVTRKADGRVLEERGPEDPNLEL